MEGDLESQLNNMIKVQNKSQRDELENKAVEENDDLNCSMDIDDFEHKLKASKKKQNTSFDSSEDEDIPKNMNQSKKKSVAFVQSRGGQDKSSRAGSNKDNSNPSFSNQNFNPMNHNFENKTGGNSIKADSQNSFNQRNSNQSIPNSDQSIPKSNPDEAYRQLSKQSQSNPIANCALPDELANMLENNLNSFSTKNNPDTRKSQTQPLSETHEKSDKKSSISNYGLPPPPPNMHDNTMPAENSFIKKNSRPSTGSRGALPPMSDPNVETSLRNTSYNKRNNVVGKGEYNMTGEASYKTNSGKPFSKKSSKIVDDTFKTNIQDFKMPEMMSDAIEQLNNKENLANAITNIDENFKPPDDVMWDIKHLRDDGTDPSQLADDKKHQRLKQLMLKNKEMGVILEKERTLRLKAESKVKEFDKILEAEEQKNQSRPKTSSDSDQWKGKYNNLEKKLQDEKLKTTRLKNDTNKAMRIIQKEVGEFSSQDDLLEGDGWRGRAQQIEILRGKVRDLQALNSSWGEGNPTMNKSGSQYYKKKETLGESAATRRKEMEDVKSQNTDLSKELNKAKEKSKGQLCRNKNLEEEVRQVKCDYELNKKLLLEKSENDNKYINAQKSEIGKSKKEIERLRNNPPDTLARVIYKAKDDIEPTSLLNFSNMGGSTGDDAQMKKELLIRDTEISKKDRIIKELINEKMRVEEDLCQMKADDQKNVEPKKLQVEIEALKLEKEDLLRMMAGGTRQSDSYEAIKDLSSENARLRMKVSELQSKIYKK